LGATKPSPIHVCTLPKDKLKFYVKREDLISPLYGGNKVRTLQHQLAVLEARRERGDVAAKQIVPLGSGGSNQVVATVVHAKRLGWDNQNNNKNNNTKPIKHLQTGKVYRGACDAADELRLSRAHISSVARGDRPHTKGHTFSFDLSTPIQPPAELQVVVRPVLHVETGIVYKDMGEASRALRIPAPNIRKVLIGERKHAQGQHFSYAD
jgi:hypothetical protein